MAPRRLVVALGLVTVSALVLSCSKTYRCSTDVSECRVACDDGKDGRACTRVGAMNQDKPLDAAENYLHGCSLGDARGCYLAGLKLYLVATDTVADPNTQQSKAYYLERAKVSFARACELKELDGCAMGTALTPRTPENAVALINEFVRACNQGSGVGCFLVGESYTEGWGVTDPNVATLYLQKACSHSRHPVQDACDRLTGSPLAPGAKASGP